MKILKIKILNYKKIEVFEVELNGNNMQIAGPPSTGKTTAISALWDIIQRSGDPVKHGEKSALIQVTLGDADGKKVLCERKITKSKSESIIMTSEMEKIGVADFKNWFTKLGENPQDIGDKKPLEQTQILLEAAELPDGINLNDLDQQRENLSEKRREAYREVEILKNRIKKEPESIESVNTSELINQLEDLREHNRKVDKTKEIINTINEDVSAAEKQIAELNKKIAEWNEKKSRAEKHLEENKKKDTSELERKISNAEKTNEKAHARKSWESDFKEYEKAESAYQKLDQKVKEIDEQKKQAKEKAKWPLDGLDVRDGQIYYNDYLISNCGKSEQMLVWGAIAANHIAKKKIKVVRMDGVESMSTEHFNKLEEIFNKRNIQVLSSRVETGDDFNENEIQIISGKYEK